MDYVVDNQNNVQRAQKKFCYPSLALEAIEYDDQAKDIQLLSRIDANASLRTYNLGDSMIQSKRVM